MQANLINLLVSDVFLSSVLLLTIALISLKAFPFSYSSIRNAPRHVRDVVLGQNLMNTRSCKDRALSAFYHYETLATIEVDQMRRSYARLSRSHKRLGYDLGYPNKLERLASTAHANSIIAKAIARTTQQEMGGLSEAPACPTNNADISKVREVFRHLVRDWSSAGSAERNATFAPIIGALSNVEASLRHGLKVLVPGSGLGRLAWEINRLGFDTTAVELSPFMNFAFRLLLSPRATQKPCQHLVHPYAHWFSHQRSNENLFRSVSIPDTIPRISHTFHHVEGDFLSLKAPKRTSLESSSASSGYDFIVTLFFIDTSLNIIASLEKIRDLLRPGGKWINLGPLLWTAGSQASLELSLDEVLQLAKKLGFEIDETSRKTVNCEYTADENAMMKWIYNAEYWSATRKP